MNDLKQELAVWPERLDAALSRCSQTLRTWSIVTETLSTQDDARQVGVPIGSVIVAGVQTAGRGRYGKSWRGAPEHGVAMSLVLPWVNAPHIALACAIGVVRGLQQLRPQSFQLGIKWPNDVLARPCGGDTLRTDEHGLYESGWRKIAGILIEQHNDRAIVGIGVNVGPSDWPEDLTARAVSLKQLNCPATRIDVMSTVLPALDEALAIDDATLRSVFRSYDLLTGCSTRVRSRGRSCCGSVLSIDPLRGLELQPHDGGEPFWCPAESTTLSD